MVEAPATPEVTVPETIPVPVAAAAPVAEAPEETEEPAAILEDAAGNQWRDLGKTETGMRKIENLDRSHTKFITEESFAALLPAGQEGESTAAAGPPFPETAPDPEKEQLLQQLQLLSERVVKLENLQEEKESPYQVKVGGLVPIFSWSKKDYESARIIEEGERNGESFYKVITAEGQTKTFFKDEVEYWFSHSTEPETVPATAEDAKKRFSAKFRAVRGELMRLGRQTGVTLSEKAAPQIDKAKEVLQPTVDDMKMRVGYVAGSAKEALATTLLTGQVLAEKAGATAKEGLVSGILAGQVAGETVGGAAKEALVGSVLTGQVVGEKIDEKAKAYRRRLLGQAAGYAAVFSVWFLGPSAVAAETDINDGAQKIELPPVTVV